MKRDSFLRFLLTSVIIVVSPYLHSATVATCSFNTNKDLIENAVALIQDELPKRSGKIYSVVARYNITNSNQTKSVETKFYFSDYHKNPETICQNFHTKNTSISRVVDVVYNLKKDKKHVYCFEKKPGKTKRKCGKGKRIAIDI
jgi:hypothetical protein